MFAAAGKVAAGKTAGDKAAGKAHAKAHGGKWAKSPTKAFKWAAKKLAAGGPMTVVVRIAEGVYKGDLGAGAYELPKFYNPEATLIFEGGWSRDFSRRDPFHTPTRFETVPGRSMSMLRFHRSKPRNPDTLAAMILDGILFDAGASNKYDKRSNSLMRSGSSTRTILDFGYLETDRLEVRHCVFMNSAHRAFETLIRARSDDAVVRLYNDVFFNCLIPVKLSTAYGKHKPRVIEVAHCSFVMNWALNPDPDTGSPCALEIGNQHASQGYRIVGNLFYANFGGGILALDKAVEGLVINGNNFCGNGLLHGQLEPEAVAMVVNAGNSKHPIDVETIEEVDYVEEAEDNVSIGPGIALAMGEVKTVDSAAVQAKSNWQNDVRRMLGQNLDGGRVEIKDFAPRQRWDAGHPPFPTVEAAKGYGASPALVK